MGVSQILIMYISSLINIVFNHNEHEKYENQYMLKINNMKACKLNES